MTLQNLSEKYAALEGRRASVERYLPERHRWRVFLIDVPYTQGGSALLNVRPRSKSMSLRRACLKWTSTRYACHVFSLTSRSYVTMMRDYQGYYHIMYHVGYDGAV